MKRDRKYLRGMKYEKRHNERLYLLIEKARKRYKENPKELLRDGAAYIQAFKSCGIDMSYLVPGLIENYMELEIDKLSTEPNLKEDPRIVFAKIIDSINSLTTQP